MVALDGELPILGVTWTEYERRAIAINGSSTWPIVELYS